MHKVKILTSLNFRMHNYNLLLVEIEGSCGKIHQQWKASSTQLWPRLEIIDEKEDNMDSEGYDEQVPEIAIAANQRKDE